MCLRKRHRAPRSISRLNPGNTVREARSEPNTSATMTCGSCGAVLATAVLKGKLRKDEVDPATNEGKEQFSADCPVCGAKRIVVENRKPG